MKIRMLMGLYLVAVIGLVGCGINDTEENTYNLQDVSEVSPESTQSDATDSLENKISYAIPDGLEQGNYTLDLVSCFAGYSFKGEQPVTELVNDAPSGWTVNGGIGINIGNAEAIYEGDELTNVIGVLDNHTAEISDPYVTHTEDFDVYVVKYCFDLFTAAEQAAYEEENGIALTEEESTSRYWYAYLCSADNTDIYVAFLNADQYTESEFLDFVSSISKR
ncbi:MAG: hypothetical protein PUB52_04735 [Lachnospiraceae bacterium]|nr:hypothetical protein [Lachnospiraceae bacterium]